MSKAAPGRAASSARSPRGRPFAKGNPYAWKQGESGNPDGIPKDRAAAATKIEKHLREEFLEEAVRLLKRRARDDASPTALIEVLNRIAGKVPDRSELTGADGDQIQLRIAARKELVAKLERMVRESGST